MAGFLAQGCMRCGAFWLAGVNGLSVKMDELGIGRCFAMTTGRNECDAALGR